MTRYVVQSWLLLLYVDFLMRWRGFERVHAAVSKKRLGQLRGSHTSASLLSKAIDIACVLYFKPALCLQRSAALVLLLRRYGWFGELVIGVQLLPFRSHAWVEIADRVVNDKPHVQHAFQILDRC